MNETDEYLKELRRHNEEDFIEKSGWLLKGDDVCCSWCDMPVHKYEPEPENVMKYRPADWRHPWNREYVGYFEPKDPEATREWKGRERDAKIKHFNQFHPPSDDWKNDWEVSENSFQGRALICKLCGWPFYYCYEDQSGHLFTAEEEALPYEWNYNEVGSREMVRNSFGEQMNARKRVHRRVCPKEKRFST